MLGEAAGAIAFWFAVVSALAGAATLPLGWIRPDGWEFLLLMGAGLLGGIAHILMTLSFRHAEAAALTPYEYLSVLWAVGIGFMVFAELPGWTLFLAAPLILSDAIIATPIGRTGSTKNLSRP